MPEEPEAHANLVALIQTRQVSGMSFFRIEEDHKRVLVHACLEPEDTIKDTYELERMRKVVCLGIYTSREEAHATLHERFKDDTPHVRRLFRCGEVPAQLHARNWQDEFVLFDEPVYVTDDATDLREAVAVHKRIRCCVKKQVLEAYKDDVHYVHQSRDYPGGWTVLSRRKNWKKRKENKEKNAELSLMRDCRIPTAVFRDWARRIQRLRLATFGNRSWPSLISSYWYWEEEGFYYRRRDADRKRSDVPFSNMNRVVGVMAYLDKTIPWPIRYFRNREPVAWLDCWAVFRPWWPFLPHSDRPAPRLLARYIARECRALRVGSLPFPQEIPDDDE